LVGRLPELPVSGNSFDLVCAFEVLEHIPFVLLKSCFIELSRVSNKLVFISVPNIKNLDAKYKISVDIKYKNWKFKKKWQRTGKETLGNPKEHYWELGIDGINKNMIINEGKGASLKFLDDNFIDPWFHFFAFSKHP